jgi:hypothetical protein
VRGTGSAYRKKDAQELAAARTMKALTGIVCQVLLLSSDEEHNAN